MKVQIIGCGCTRSNILESRVKQAVYRLGVDVEICRITDGDEAGRLGGIMLPGLFVDGQKVVENQIPSVDELTDLLKPFLSQG